MIHVIVAFGMLLHAVWWGAGAALLMMPRPWRRFWPVLVLVLGFALQSAAMTLAVLATRGPEASILLWILESVPIVLLVLGLRRHGRQAAWVDVSRFGLVWALVGGTLALLLVPLLIASDGLATVDLGGSRAVSLATTTRAFLAAIDGASGAYAFETLTRAEFMPVTLLAHSSSVWDRGPAELVTVQTMVVLAGSVPVVFWVARALIGYNGVASLVVALLYGIAPITWHAMGHGALGRLLAAQGIALMTWIGVSLWRRGLARNRVVPCAGTVAVGFWLVLGNSSVDVRYSMVPALIFAVGWAIWRRTGRRLARWLAAVGVPLVVAGWLFTALGLRMNVDSARVTEQATNENVPVLFPEAWLGMVSGPRLEAWDFLGLRWLFALGVVVAMAWAMWRTVREGRWAAWLVTSLVIPLLLGYVWLERREISAGYELLGTFHALLLPAMCWWMTLRRSRRLVDWFGVMGLVAFVVACNVVGIALFGFAIARSPTFGGDVVEIQTIEPPNERP